MSSDRRQATPQEAELIRTATASQVCILRDGKIIRVQREAVAAALEHAFRSAAHEAMQTLGIVRSDQLSGLDCDPTETWRTGYLRVTATDHQGRKTSAIAMVADPREN